MEGYRHEKRKVYLDKDLAMEIYNDGCHDPEYIASQTGVVPETVKRWMRQNNLPYDGKKDGASCKRQRTQLEQDAYDAYQLGMTYGQFKAKYPIGLPKKPTKKGKKK